jgi:hypothetical protein
MQTDFTNRISTVGANQAKVDTTVAADRAKITANFEAKVQVLEAEAGLTKAQLAAITLYATNMKAAETTREAAVDAARTTYRTALTNAITTQQTALTIATNSFQISLKTAFANAVTNCGDGTALTTLKASIVSSRAVLTSERDSAKTTAAIQVLATTRDTAIKAADATFAKDAATYTATLAAVLPTT